MLCTYCNAPRVANEAPCPQCGAPSPLIGGTMGSYGNAQPSAVAPASLASAPSPQQDHALPTDLLPEAANNKRLRALVMAPVVPAPTQPLPQNQQPSLLPVPYQPGIGVAVPMQQSAIVSPNLPMTRATARVAPTLHERNAQLSRVGAGLAPALGAPPDAAGSPNLPMTRATATVAPTLHERDAQLSMLGAGLVPALGGPPDAAESIHIPPMYTKPRAIIPPYRIISGLLSLLLVAALLCSAAVYYANASGSLAFLHQLWGDVQPQNLPPVSARSLPDPPLNPDYGPAKAIINSASTASKIDPQTDVALQPNNVFAPGQVIYLTYSVHPNAQGVVVIKWFTDGVLYKTITSKPIAAAKNGVFTAGSFSIQYAQPIEGKVELYWNNQLAIRLYFVVR